MLVSWQFSGTYGVTKYGSGWRKAVVNQCLEFEVILDCSYNFQTNNICNVSNNRSQEQITRTFFLLYVAKTNIHLYTSRHVVNGRLSCGSPRLVALGIFGALTKLKSVANDLPYTIQVALGLFGQCNAHASKITHSTQSKSCIRRTTYTRVSEYIY